jgi:hypothetical protein
MDIDMTIRQLCGGGFGRLRAMIGAKMLVQVDDWTIGIRFTSKAKNSANHVTIKLESDDTYTVTFWRCPPGLEVSSASGVYGDQLRSYFERETGLIVAL